MGKLAKRVLVLIALTLAVPAVEAKVQCTCPKVAADGEGQTSCSAAESGGRCTVDFNLFGPESEARAADLVTRHGGKAVRVDAQLNTMQAMEQMATRRPDELAGLVLVYLTVGIANQSARLPLTVKPQPLNELMSGFKSGEIEQRVFQAFNGTVQSNWRSVRDEELRQRSNYQVERLRGFTISPGCIEFSASDGTWMMFKMPWAPSRLSPQCSPRR